MALAVEVDEIGIPVARERVGDDLRGFPISAQLQEALRRGARDLRLSTRRIREPAPGIAQTRNVVRERAQLLALRGNAHLLALGLVEDFAFHELSDEGRD